MCRSGGFSLIETMLALTLTLIVSAGMLAAVGSGQKAVTMEPELAEQQQRLRVASHAIAAEILLAGAPAAGVSPPSLARTVATVLPFRGGPIDPDPPGTFKSGTITVIYAAAGGSRTTTAGALAPADAGVAINALAGCPVTGAGREPGCGFRPGAPVMFFDDDGASERVLVSAVSGSWLQLQGGGGRVHTYPAGSTIMPVTSITYYWQEATGRLMRYNGVESDAPVIDGVSEVRFEYFGAAPVRGGALVPLTAGELTDGPWRPDAVDPNRYDIDLLRIRRVAVHLGLRASVAGAGVPDLEFSFDVSPRSLNGGS